MAQGWTVAPVPDTITFYEGVVAGVNNIVVREYASSSKNVTDVWALGAWSAAFGYPSEVEYFSDRLVFAHTPRQPQTLWMSASGNYTSFARSQPTQDDDAITATLNARQVNAIRDLVPLDKLILLTSGGEWKTTGGQEDVLTPTTIGFKPQSYRGASVVPALLIGSTALFVQDRGYIVRDLTYSFEADGYTGNDITVFSSHLLENKPIREWTYQQVPHSIVWVVREDGGLLALTYMREQDVVGWAPQVTDGFVESICTVPEGTEDAVYAIIRRTIGGVQRRYIERLSTRLFTDVRECTFLDSHLTYRGMRTGTPVVLRANAVGVGGYTSDDVVQVVADFGASSVFAPTDVGDQLWLYDPAGIPLRMTIVGYNAPQSVSVMPLRNVPVNLQASGPGTSSWAFARDTMSGLDHLEGRSVSILADGFVHQPLTVVGGSITLDQPHALVHAGLGYVSDFETLEVTNPGGESARTRFKTIKKVGLLLQDSRGIWVGPDADHLDEWEPRLAEDYEKPPDLQQDVVEMWIQNEWASKGRVFVRQVDPLPLSILGVITEVEYGQ